MGRTEHTSQQRGVKGLAPNPYSADHGSVDPGVAAALQAWSRDGDTAAVVAAIRDTRVLVSLVTPRGKESSADLAMAILEAPDGRPALPVFTSVQNLARFDPAARPVPVLARQACLAAVDEDCELVVVDPGGPVTVTMPRPAVWAVAKGEPWVPSYADEQLCGTICRAACEVASVQRASCCAGDRAELGIVLQVAPGLDRAALAALTAAVQERIGALEEVAQRVDSIQLTLR